MTTTTDTNVVSIIGAAEYVPETGPKAGLNCFNPCSHVANANRIVKHFSDCLLYVEGIGWHTWGGPWKHDDLGARRLVHELGRIISAEAAELATWVAAARDKAERAERQAAMDARFKWASSSESAPCVELSLQAAMPYLAIKAAELDANPMLLGLPSGVLDLETGEHREHRQTDRITKVAGCDFDPNAKAPTWERFVSEVFGGDEELMGYT